MGKTAILDTGFWSQAVRAGVSEPLLADYTLIAPPEVEAELNRWIVPPPPENAARFAASVQTGRIRIQQPTVRRLKLFGAGERACLDLAFEMPGTVLLINEAPAYRYAQSHRLPVLHVPLYIVGATVVGRLTPTEAVEALHRIRNQTAPDFLTHARRVLEGFRR